MPMGFIQVSCPHAPGEEAPGKVGRRLLALLSTGVCPKVPVCRAALSALAWVGDGGFEGVGARAPPTGSGGQLEGAVLWEGREGPGGSVRSPG